MVRLPFLSLCALSLASRGLANLPPQVAMLPNEPIHTTEGWSYEVCGLPSDPIQISSIEVSPSPPQPGKDLTITVTGTAVEIIEEGAYADVLVKLGLVKLLKKRFDVCEEARNNNVSVQCPVDKGTYTVVHTVPLPREIPRAKFGVDVQGFTVNDDDLFCLKLKVDFMKRPFFMDW